MAMVPVYADQFDTVNYIGSVGVNYDDNIYRLPSGYDPQIYLGKATKSDLIKTASLGINLNKKYSNQEVTFKAVENLNKYSNFTNLDYTSSSFNGAWNWQLTPRFSGALSSARSQTLNNPADTRVFTRDLNTSTNTSLNGDWWIHSNWHLLIGLSDGQNTNSSNTTNFQSSNSRSHEWGVKYDPSNGKSVSLISRNLRGENLNQVPDPVNVIDSGTTENQLELRLAWELSGRSTLNGNLMKIDHQSFHYSERDYSGTQGGLTYTLNLSGKTSLNLTLQRSLNSWVNSVLSSSVSNYFVNDSIAISPTWQVSQKAVLRMTISHGTNDYYGPAIPGAITRHDVTQSVLMGIDWTPQRAVTVSASMQHNKRISTPDIYNGYGFDENAAALSVQAYF